jgi:hypothetical protein
MTRLEKMDLEHAKVAHEEDDNGRELIVAFVAFLTSLMLFVVSVLANSTTVSQCTMTYAEEEYGDPEPVSDMDEKPSLSNEERARLVLIGRLAEGIRKVGKNKGGGRWWECGKIYKPEEEATAAIEWAARIVWLSSEYSDRGSLNGYQLNPWEIAGVAVNECGMDRCALGKYPRKWGYEHGTLRRSRFSISHTYEDIEKTLTDPRGKDVWTTAGLDGAPMHVLWKCKDKMCWPKFNREGLPPIQMRDVFSLGMGFEYNVREFKKRAIDYRTRTPSLYWRGYKCEWYREKIINWEKRLGARKDEI